MFKFKDILFLCLSSVAVLSLGMKRHTLTLGLAACKSAPQLLQLVVSKAHAHMRILHPAQKTLSSHFIDSYPSNRWQVGLCLC